MTNSQRQKFDSIRYVRSSFLFFTHQFEYFIFLSVLNGVLLICSAQYTSVKRVNHPAYIPLDRNEGKTIIVKINRLSKHFEY